MFQKPKTAVQGLHLLSFGTAYLIFHALTCTCMYLHVNVHVPECISFLVCPITYIHVHMCIIHVCDNTCIYMYVHVHSAVCKEVCALLCSLWRSVCGGVQYCKEVYMYVVLSSKCVLWC